MLDSVPDKVLVCSFERDAELRPSPIYNNRKMTQFFGADLVLDQEAKKNIKKSPAKPLVKRKKMFEKRVFSSKNSLSENHNRDIVDLSDNQVQESGSAKYDDGEISLAEIVTRH